MNDAACEERGKRYDERFDRDLRRIEKLEDLTAKISECNVKLSEIIKTNNEKLGDHEKRLDAIESRPTQWWDKVISGIIAAAVTVLMGVIMKS
jgi:hypothetical protein